MARAVLDFFAELDVRLIHCYGQAETCGLLTWTLGIVDNNNPTTAAAEGPDQQLVAVGEALPECEFKVAADDCVGEILVRGPHLFTEYFQDPALTAQARSADGWFHTGDVGRLDSQGCAHPHTASLHSTCAPCA